MAKSVRHIFGEKVDAQRDPESSQRVSESWLSSDLCIHEVKSTMSRKKHWKARN
jgi:hypothetical protein